MSAPTLQAVLRTAAPLDGLAALQLGRDRVLVTWAAGPAVLGASADWRARCRALLRPPVGPSVGFSGGLVGWVSYEAGATMERMPARAPGALPALALWRVDGGLTWDGQRWTVAGSDAFRAQAEALLTAAARVEAPPAAPSVRPAASGAWASRPRDATRQRYEDGVRAVLAAIRAGDVYQVNLSWEESGLPVADPLAAWLALRLANPARRGAFLRWGAHTLVSNSPELFLAVRARGHRRWALSVPIKGTADARAGAAARQALLDSEKERAELTMIVDLVRNDLGRVARKGGVHAGPRRIVRCGDLWHAEQPVRATLRRDRDALDAFAASFPPGSVTGAPKVEAMRVIADLEPAPRGVYCGAIGCFADGGAAHFSVAIRTATLADGLARFHVGAGLVADSDPAREWAETLAKGRALAGALAGD